MTHHDSQSDIQAEVLNKISQGSIRMKPRVYFTILWILAIAASIAASLSIAYFINMLTYVIRIQTASTPAYGARQNLQDSLATFPWWSLVLSIVLVLIAGWLLRSYSRIYRFKLRSIVILFVLFSCVLGIGMSYANIGHSIGKNKRTDTIEQRNTSSSNHKVEIITP